MAGDLELRCRIIISLHIFDHLFEGLVWHCCSWLNLYRCIWSHVSTLDTKVGHWMRNGAQMLRVARMQKPKVIQDRMIALRMPATDLSKKLRQALLAHDRLITWCHLFTQLIFPVSSLWLIYHRTTPVRPYSTLNLLLLLWWLYLNYVPFDLLSYLLHGLRPLVWDIRLVLLVRHHHLIFVFFVLRCDHLDHWGVLDEEVVDVVVVYNISITPCWCSRSILRLSKLMILQDIFDGFINVGSFRE